jgi:hypothetical protein
MNQWWITFVEHYLLRKLAEALREEFDLPSAENQPIEAREIEFYWLFHRGIFYYGQRREVYGHTCNVSLASFIEASVDALLNGLPKTLRGLLMDKPSRVDSNSAAARLSLDN